MSHESILRDRFFVIEVEHFQKFQYYKKALSNYLACETVLFSFICFEKVVLSSLYDINDEKTNKRIHNGAKYYISLHLHLHIFEAIPDKCTMI